MAKRVGGKVTLVGDPQSFEAVPLGMATLPSPDREALLAFQRKTARLQRAVLGVVESVKEASSRLAHLKKAIDETPGADLRLGDRTRSLESSLQELRLSLVGDTVVASKNEPTPPSIVDRVQRVVGGHWWTTQASTDTQR